MGSPGNLKFVPLMVISCGEEEGGSVAGETDVIVGGVTAGSAFIRSLPIIVKRGSVNDGKSPGIVFDCIIW